MQCCKKCCGPHQIKFTFTIVWANSDSRQTDDESYFYTLTFLCKLSAKETVIFFIYFPENRLWHFMQIVSLEDSLHEISKPIFWEK